MKIQLKFLVLVFFKELMNALEVFIIYDIKLIKIEFNNNNMKGVIIKANYFIIFNK